MFRCFFSLLQHSFRPRLERDISPDFLAAHEAQRQRLYSFIRRELRVLAPWLAYQSTTSDSSLSSNVNTNATARSASSDTTGPGGAVLIVDEPQAGSAVTAPLICGAPGLLADTPELDAITERVVSHFTSVPMTNTNALRQLLASVPALRYPLVPSTYLTHFCSEVIQFARYSGTLDQYDYAVCLYRRYPSHLSIGQTEPSERDELRVTRRDPRLAVYMGSACWPRLRPGFAEPQCLVTHPLINWLHQRLFVHSVSGSIHPATLPQTGRYTQIVSEPLSFHYSRSSCHPHCSRLASLSQALLEAVPTIMRFRAAPIQPDESHTIGRSGLTGLDRDVLRPDRGMTSTELFPNRIVYQRILSELIDQARFSEALGSYFATYSIDGASSSADQNAISRVTVSEPIPRPSSGTNSLFDLYGSLVSERSTEAVANGPSSPSSSSRTNRSTIDHLAPALDMHSQALRRLSSLLLLFTARVPSGLRGERDEDVITELIHTPLMPMTVPPINPVGHTSPQVIDLTTNNSTQTLRPGRRLSMPLDGSHVISEADSSRFANSDWHFLFQPSLASWTSSNSHSTSRPMSSVAVSDLGSLDLSAHRGRYFPELSDVPAQQQQQQHPHQPVAPRQPSPTEVIVPSPFRPADILGTNNDDSTVAAESHWRSPIRSFVIISSDSSSDEEDNLVVRQVTPDQRVSVYPTTDDESEHESKSATEQLKGDVLNPSASEPPHTVESSELLTVQDTTSRLSLEPNSAGTELSTLPSSSSFLAQPRAADQQIEEPMDVDEKPDDSISLPVSSVTGVVKRPLSSSDPSASTSLPRAAKLPRVAEPSRIHFSIRPRLALYESHDGERLISHGTRAVYCYHPRRRKSHGHNCSRSPIVLESSESDCELLRESIRVYSDSSSCSASSTSWSSTSSPSVSRSSSPSSSSSESFSHERPRGHSHSQHTVSSAEHRKRKDDDSSRHRHRHHRCHHHRRHRCHSCRKHKKQGHRPKCYKCVGSKHHRYTGKHDKFSRRKPIGSSQRSRYYPRLRLVRQHSQTVQLNSVASPILISDDENESSSHPAASDLTQRTTNNATMPTTSSTESVTTTKNIAGDGESQSSGSECVESHPSVSSVQPDRNFSEASDVPGPSVLMPGETSVANESAGELVREVPSSSQPIFEPSNLDEFYQFLAELGSQQHHVESKSMGPEGSERDSEQPHAESLPDEASVVAGGSKSTESSPTTQS